jgi:uncharacterized protein YqhQ
MTAESEKPSPTNVGGQALIEGVLMRAPGSLAIACRRRDGSITLRERSMPAASGTWQKTPLLRGMSTLVSSLKLGFSAMTWAAELQAEDDEDQEPPSERSSKPERRGEAKKSSSTLSTLLLSAAWPVLWSDPDLGDVAAKPKVDEPEAAKLEAPQAPAPRAEAPKPVKKKPAAPPPEEEEEEAGGLSQLLFVIPILFAIGLFIALPQLVAEGVNSAFGLGLAVTAPLFQVITGASKLTVIVLYMSMLRLTKSGYRVFQYHGAEHKSISTYEAKQDLLVENARKTTALHARCGTTFIIMVAFVSVVLFSAVGAFLPPIPGPRIVQSVTFFLMKLPLLPLVAGITFELQRFFAKYCSTGPLQFLLWPGFLVQKITTATPDDEQLEVALASLRSALARSSETLPEDHPDKSFPTYASLVSDPAYASTLALLGGDVHGAPARAG